jgi:hypothetical protein
MNLKRRTLLAATLAAFTAPIARVATAKGDALFGGGIYCKAARQGDAPWRS